MKIFRYLIGIVGAIRDLLKHLKYHYFTITNINRIDLFCKTNGNRIFKNSLRFFRKTLKIATFSSTSPPDRVWIMVSKVACENFINTYKN